MTKPSNAFASSTALSLVTSTCLAALSWGLLFAACTLVAELDVTQCNRDADCAKFGLEYETYACQQEVCVPARCESAEECTRRAPMSRTSYICLDNICSPAECMSNPDCLDRSPTSTCEAGQCVDVWDCVGQPLPLLPRSALSFRAQVLDLYTNKVPSKLRAFACLRTDISCGMPLGGPYTPDREGVVSFEIEGIPNEGFDGYIRFEAEGELPLEYHFVAPRREDFTASDTFSMIPPGTIASLASFAGLEVDEDEAALINIDLFDCRDKPAAGLLLVPRSAPDAVFYTSDSSFVPTLDAPQTEASGRGGLVNVPVGFAAIDVVHVASGTTLFTFRLPVHAGTLILSVVRAQEQVVLVDAE